MLGTEYRRRTPPLVVYDDYDDNDSEDNDDDDDDDK